MLSDDKIELLRARGRVREQAQTNDDELGPFALLPGEWANLPGLPGRGWNMIALPFAKGGSDYRLLLNQYNETLKFTTVSKSVPNRGIRSVGGTTVQADQFLAALDYEQSITQIAVADSPASDATTRGAVPSEIHHEPGLLLHMANQVTGKLDIARLATIPHGNSVLALGTHAVAPGSPKIPDVQGLPVGVKQDLNTRYLAPYKHFHDNLFEGLFDPTDATALLSQANQGVQIARTTTLHYDTTFESGGIVNIPFVERQANATAMHATFWIQELAAKDENGDPRLRLQYVQTVILEFFTRTDGLPGRIQWPHISINTLERVAGPSAS